MPADVDLDREFQLRRLRKNVVEAACRLVASETGCRIAQVRAEANLKSAVARLTQAEADLPWGSETEGTK